MEREEVKLTDALFSQFRDDQDTLYIKNYAKKLTELDDFKDLKLYCVAYNDTDTFKKNLKLVNFEQLSKMSALILE